MAKDKNRTKDVAAEDVATTEAAADVAPAETVAADVTLAAGEVAVLGTVTITADGDKQAPPVDLAGLKARVVAQWANVKAAKEAVADATRVALSAEHDCAVAALAAEEARTGKAPKRAVQIEIDGVRRRTYLDTVSGRYRLDVAPSAPPVIY